VNCGQPTPCQPQPLEHHQEDHTVVVARTGLAEAGKELQAVARTGLAEVGKALQAVARTGLAEALQAVARTGLAEVGKALQAIGRTGQAQVGKELTQCSMGMGHRQLTHRTMGKGHQLTQRSMGKGYQPLRWECR